MVADEVVPTGAVSRGAPAPDGAGTKVDAGATTGWPGVDSMGRNTGMTDATLDLATVWEQIRERLSTSLSPQQNAMLNLTRPLGLVEDTAVLAAPTQFTQNVTER